MKRYYHAWDLYHRIFVIRRPIEFRIEVGDMHRD